MNKLSSKHYMFFILGTCMIALRSYSSVFVRLGGRDTWIISFFASLILLLYVLYLFKICKSTDTYDMNIIISSALPKWCSIPFKFIFSLGLFLTAVESASVEASSIHTNYFLSTPTWYCLLFLIIPATYVLSKKFNAILILIILTVCITLLGDVALISLVAKYLDFSHLLPILNGGMSSNKWSCLLLLLGSLSSVAIAFPYLKFLDKKKGFITDSVLALIICCILIVTSFISIITFFGPERAGNIFYPEFVESQRVQIANFFEFGEIFYIFRSVCMWFIKYILSSYGILLLYKDKIKNKKVFIFCYSIIIFISSWYMTLNQYYLFSLLKLLQLFLLVPFILIPLISFSLYKLKKVK
ncbi:GerAB/ArcD/ProY family transporter [Clostridium paraputrificum]|uniref:GerAB/ArcD/ProY family transporter n=1 Tax=Clostridium TaxID=1485 RepID=UPI003D359A7B